MHMTHIVGDSLDNLYLLVHHDDWGLDDPEGIAHWNGKEWIWYHLFNEPRARWTTAMLFNRECPILLDVGGVIKSFSPKGNIQVHAPPDFIATAPAGRFPDHPSFWDFVFLDADTLGVVGDLGLFYIFHDGRWQYVETGTKRNISKIIGRPPHCYLCGDQTLIQFDGISCTILEPDLPLDLIDMDLAPDGGIFMASISQARRCYLCSWKDSTFSVMEMPNYCRTLRVRSSEEIYCCGSDGVLSWDGSNFHRSLPQGSGSRGTVDNLIFFGSWQRDNLIYFDPPNWKKLKIDLDEASIFPG